MPVIQACIHCGRRHPEQHWHGMTDMGTNPFTDQPMWASHCNCGWFGKIKISHAAAIVDYAHHLGNASEVGR